MKIMSSSLTSALPPPPALPFVLGMANWKGGSCKTTGAINLACAAEENGQKVLILDCDLAQGSALLWSELRGHTEPLRVCRRLQLPNRMERS
jgi:cellulose biosynthesis protein BcsQ